MSNARDGALAWPVDRWVTWGYLACALGAVAWALPPVLWVLALVVTLLALAAWTVIARAYGRPVVNINQTMLSRFGTIAAVAFAFLGVVRVVEGASLRFAVGFGAVACGAVLGEAVWLWGIARWCARRDGRLQRDSLKTDILVACFAASMYAIFAVPVAIVIAITKPEIRLATLAIIPGFYVGVAASAVVSWAMMPLAHLVVGRYATGMIAGWCYAAPLGAAVVQIARVTEKRPPSLLLVWLIVSLGVGALYGPVLSVGWFGKETRREVEVS